MNKIVKKSVLKEFLEMHFNAIIKKSNNGDLIIIFKNISYIDFFKNVGNFIELIKDDELKRQISKDGSELIDILLYECDIFVTSSQDKKAQFILLNESGKLEIAANILISRFKLL